jgi:predicted DCC family thiol-disulfide oxidoreductase YuxK
MQIYRRRETAGRLKFIDISSSDFNPAEYNLSLANFMQELHVRDAEGQFHTGVDAFAQIWQALPESPLYSLLRRTVMFPGIKQGADLAYAAFARFRHLLPKTNCQDGHCGLH